ncbi:cytochrome b/b6 domain-containing protein [Maritimibacter sp. UBA3975]|uniref:cytochrome b n=1 Tax=Maritimibacter sp. UBA3975 TaxID=1946833 RepID=UPI000C096619|nr:cytochrome b/b6 domain-containing protein [Maritimibacter sp. UBA3975]MAM63610.1 cytochrome B [Maritimibacter sp.]|tara:strand:- start:9189 stop:9722 length:534 start_codon:yes stop_codon:yes gene_type:complete
MIRNTTSRFGLATRSIHWITALLVIGMLGFGTYIARMEVDMSNFHLFGWHKSVGILTLALVILRLGWHRASPPPGPMPSGPAWQDKLARVAHVALYLLLLAVPLTGWIASAATGIDVVVFDIWTLPRIAPVSEGWEDAFFLAHGVLTKLLAALVLLHVAGAFHRRDGTLRRMLRGRA